MTLAALQPLVGCRIERVDMPRQGLLCLSMHSAQRRGVLLASLTRPAGLGWVEKRPRGEPASAFVRQLRKHLRGARLHDARRWQGACLLELQRAEASWQLALELDNAVLLDSDGTAVGAWHPGALQKRNLRIRKPYRPPPDAEVWHVPASFEALRHAGVGLLSRRGDADLEHDRAVLRRAVKTRQRALKRRLEAIRNDAARAGQARLLRHHAAALLARLHGIPSDARHVEITDPEQGGSLTLTIDARLGPAGQADAWFHRARRLERGARIAAEREQLTLQTQEELESLRAGVEQVRDRDGLRALREQASRLGCKLAARDAGTSKAAATTRSPYRCFHGETGHPIWVGRSAADNDKLLRAARPFHLWLHARDTRGAHVIVPLRKNTTCSSQLLADAAMLAAHFSDARGEPRTDVLYAPRRYIRKPKGAPAGLALAEREKVFPLRVDPARLRQLLASESRET